MVTNGHKWAYKGYKHGVMTRGRPGIYRGARRAILAILAEPSWQPFEPSLRHSWLESLGVYLWESEPETGRTLGLDPVLVYEHVWILSLPFWLWSWESVELLVTYQVVLVWLSCECVRVSWVKLLAVEIVHWSWRRWFRSPNARRCVIVSLCEELLSWRHVTCVSESSLWGAHNTLVLLSS